MRDDPHFILRRDINVLRGAEMFAATGLTIAGKKALDYAAATGKLAEEQLNMSERTGLSVREVGLFSGAATVAGVNANALVTSMRSLSQGLSENSDEGRKAKRAMEELGVATHDGSGQVKPTAELFLDLSAALQKIPDPAERARLAIATMGERRAGVASTAPVGSVRTDPDRRKDRCCLH